MLKTQDQFTFFLVRQLTVLIRHLENRAVNSTLQTAADERVPCPVYSFGIAENGFFLLPPDPVKRVPG